MQSYNKLQQMIRAMPTIKRENQYWSFENNKICYKETHKTLSLSDFQELLTTAQDYFRFIFDSEKSETQVLIVTNDMYDKYEFPKTIALHSYDPNYQILVPPQKNSLTNTIVDESWWYNNFTKRNITPFMRIHSHHILDAYQSKTDYNFLNSNTLEVVIGQIYDDLPPIAYWLDQTGKSTKKNVFII